jgi:hypothetical protein
MADGSFSFPDVLSGSQYRVEVKTHPATPVQECTLANDRGTVEGQPIANVRVTCATKTFTVGGTVIGLLGDQLVLKNNGGDDLALTANGRFTFSTPVANNAAYVVTVAKSPANPTQACTLANDQGTIGLSNVTDVVITCSTANFYIEGTVTNLLGSDLELANGTDRLTISAGTSTFRFPTAVPSGSAYDVQVRTQPSGPHQTCSVNAGTGTVLDRNVSLTVECVTVGFVIGGTVSNLNGAGLALQINGGETIQIAASGRFQFPTPLVTGTFYNVVISSQPTNPNPAHFCYFLTGSSGTVGTADINDIVVTCL